MTNIPTYLQDAKDLLTADGFAINNVWYHGTSSALVDSILEYGLKRSGDQAIKQAAKKTMATIGNNYTESIEPIFLTQSRELAYYWAEQAVRTRQVRFEGDEAPAVLAIELPDTLSGGVKPDVGAASLLMIEGEAFFAYLGGIYQACGLGEPNIDLMQADRMEYLTKLGMAYYNKDIDAQYVSLVTA